jgi:BirA family transcriptional regulator, biotin operon repressor / biotin---[acetyl-CoA-carboxylase] ligase
MKSKERVFFNNIRYLETIDSTNTYLKENDLEDRTLVYTFNQTKGRGRENRKWVDFKNKNLALSILIKPINNDISPIWFIAVVSLSLIELLKEYRIKNSWIKWPNDIYIDDKKISGILSESVWSNMKIEKIITGIGININSDTDDLKNIDKKTTSIYTETGKICQLNDIAEKITGNLTDLFFLLYSKNGSEKIKKKWMKYCRIKGKHVIWNNKGEKIPGKIIKIENDGTLIIKSENENFRILSGEIDITF